jgi:hypothetical protein
VERTPVASKSLRSVGYDETASELEVEFQSGRVYCYRGVPAQLYQWLMRSPGKGGLFNRLIRDRYPVRDVTESPSTPADLSDALRRSLERERSD